MTGRTGRHLWLLLAVGAIGRLVLAATTHGNPSDIQNLQNVQDVLVTGRPLHVYNAVNTNSAFVSWPYPPGFFLPLRALRPFSATGLPFSFLVKLPSIAADLALTFSVWTIVQRRAGERAALMSAAVICLGPSFWLNSGVHGQIDAVAILPVVVGVAVWEGGGDRRAIVAGLLIGLGASVKSIPGVFVLALLPTARSRREGATALAAAAVVPLVALLPFLAADHHAVLSALTYRGLPGIGGLSVAAQPSLTVAWLGRHLPVQDDLTRTLQDVGALLIAAALVVAMVRLLRARTPASTAAVVIAVTIWVFGINFGAGYLLWGLPFIAIAVSARAALAVQVATIVPTLMFETITAVGGWPPVSVKVVYIPLMLAALAAAAVWWVRLLLRTGPSTAAA